MSTMSTMPKYLMLLFLFPITSNQLSYSYKAFITFDNVASVLTRYYKALSRLHDFNESSFPLKENINFMLFYK